MWSFMSSKYICSNCGKYCNTFYKRNSILRDLMWLIFIFVSMGLALIFYIIFKLNNRVENCCPFCKAENTLVPIDSPKGKQIVESLNLNTLDKFYADNSPLSDEENSQKMLRGIALFLIAIIIFLGILASL